MKKLALIALVLFYVVAESTAQQKSALQFNSEGSFKIVQFTDTHIDYNRGRNLDAYDHMRKIVEMEHPDLVVLTGDIVTQNDPQAAYDRIDSLFAAYQIPWTITYGNHDSEHNLSRKELADYSGPLVVLEQRQRRDLWQFELCAWCK